MLQACFILIGGLQGQAMQGGPTPPLAVPPSPPGAVPPATPSKLTGGKLVLIVLAIIGLCAVPLIGILAALSIYGVRKYVINAKLDEASRDVPRLAAGIARCADEPDTAGAKRGLPESSAVPASLAPLRGTKYQSSPAEWGGAFACAGFSRVGPQYFQYQWEKRSPTSGAAIALGDFDADGTAEVRVEQEVTCASGGACTVGPLVKSGP